MHFGSFLAMRSMPHAAWHRCLAILATLAIGLATSGFWLALSALAARSYPQ